MKAATPSLRPAGAGHWLGRRFRGRVAGRWTLLALLIAASTLHLWRIDRGWSPSDEGTLAHAAERAAAGELPHRDFDDVYTGGQALLHAAAYDLFGADLITPRRLLFAVYVLTVPAVLFLAGRFLPPAAAFLAGLLALAWNVPIYPAAMPSWYNLLLALLGAATLVKYDEQRAPGWLFAAGALGGVSCAMKITGLYFVAGALLFLHYRAQDDARGGRSVAGTALHLGAVGLFVLLVGAMLGPRLTGSEALYFLLPVTAVAGVLARRELGHFSAGRRVPTPYREAGLLVAGVALPLLLLAIPYAASGALHALARGVFVVPFARIEGAAAPPPSPVTLACALPLAALLYLLVRHGRSGRLAVILMALLAAAGLSWGSHPPGFAMVAASMRWVPVIAVLAAVATLLREHPDVPPDGRGRLLFLLAALTAVVSLVQYPHGHPIYLWYVAPLAVLTVAGLTGMVAKAPPWSLGVLALFYIAFTVQQLERLPNTEPLGIARASLRVSRADAIQYRRVVALLRAHARSEYIYAGPDAPEVYFLSGLRNPTRHMFEFLAQEGNVEPSILAGIERHGVSVIALHRGAQFSRFSPALLAELERRFPASERVGDLEVRWQP